MKLDRKLAVLHFAAPIPGYTEATALFQVIGHSNKHEHELTGNSFLNIFLMFAFSWKHMSHLFLQVNKSFS